ncbi:tyrosine-type recombinase/integrase [Alicyclobacillus tolerans]|uniref:tyrosine-type recombinase/integrase n=1 Tax=Alicyclobacillus tolerans TaxID=90970 RepID=UPI003B7DA1E6
MFSQSKTHHSCRGGLSTGSPQSRKSHVCKQRWTHDITALKRNLPPVAFHGLRHTHAMLLLMEKVPLKVVSEHLGHASITMTADAYAHVTDTMQREAVEE